MVGILNQRIIKEEEKKAIIQNPNPEAKGIIPKAEVKEITKTGNTAGDQDHEEVEVEIEEGRGVEVDTEEGGVEAEGEREGRRGRREGEG